MSTVYAPARLRHTPGYVAYTVLAPALAALSTESVSQMSVAPHGCLFASSATRACVVQVT